MDNYRHRGRDRDRERDRHLSETKTGKDTYLQGQKIAKNMFTMVRILNDFRRSETRLLLIVRIYYSKLQSNKSAIGKIKIFFFWRFLDLYKAFEKNVYHHALP